ncbi:MAG: ankyrin repeat domain-containing protein [Thermotogae bacterium]|nr:ankyrin repeat domain-containing protein [Thermotogota bacterium]
MLFLLLGCPYESPIAAASVGDVEALKCWLKRNKDYRGKSGETPLHVAALNGNLKAVIYLLEMGVSPNDRDKRGRTPLHLAAIREHYDVVKALVDAGADPNAQDEDGNTPLHYAAVVGSLKIVKFLLERGADPSLRNLGGMTPCDLTGSSELKKALKSCGR